ncbi:response regulator containing CheY-like receiver domain and AraC-type DNA-binding domain [Desulfosporosinus orientis DSM 765]|uniref:Stage 0 sporulation protein A homolog n=1 Tax=Desulfosporosinus orientis (strain ATCC 19365 / DSM 765 / NCIMB 8382 / VKM B-1628 / Singapore I) TaxID=768706 RepID=G7WEG7_DESOD|nr:helix-turn-helix domain-containing protein [Desulfosporosinus orientis]AET70780.1 response regulator containing CheY-like receiver domain and AraC-type DNA-binding domain [Desulfosporosinus orientis DSM 765]
MSVVLIVEDELLELEFLKSIAAEELLPEDKLITCESGVQAVKLAKQYRPDVIVMDILIPEMDGLQALQEIKKFLPQVCVMILSACSEFSYAQKAIRLRVLEYMLKPVKPSVFKQAFRELLAAAAEVSKINDEEEIEEEKSDQIYLIEKSLNYIHDNFKQKLPLQLVSSKVFLNPQYFSRIFKKEVGVSYIDYVNKLKIEYACKLLETTDYPAYRISSECGFTDPSYFNRVFVQQMKMTPKAYRRKFLCDSDDKS